MSPTFTHDDKGQVYRYYVSAPLQQGRRRDPSDETIRRVPADAIESLVKSCLERLGGTSTEETCNIVYRVEIQVSTVQLLVKRSAFFKRASDPQTELELLARKLQPGERISRDIDDGTLVRITLPCRLDFKCGRVWITDEQGRVVVERPQPDNILIQALQTAHKLLATTPDQMIGRPEALEIAITPKRAYDRNVCRMVFLAPDIQAAILEGRQPHTVTLARMLETDIPPLWADQRRVLGFPC